MKQELANNTELTPMSQPFSTIKIKKIAINGGTQSRAAINEQTVAEYSESMLAGVKFPPIILYYDGETHWLADGFHRVHAASKAGLEEIEADIRQGDKRVAVLHSVGANAIHGLRRTNGDKRRAVMCLLEDGEWNKWSNREIAKRCGVDHKTVGTLRNTLSLGKFPSMKSSSRTFTHHRTGLPTTMNIANIGSSQDSNPNKSDPPLPIEANETPWDQPAESSCLLLNQITEPAERAPELAPEDELWTDREIDKQDAMRCGETVVLNMHTDHRLMRWAIEKDLFVRADRKSVWGNPFHMGLDGDRDEVCIKYEQHYFPHKPSLISLLQSLKGKVLGCWCDPSRCHAHTIRDLAMKVRQKETAD